MSFRLHEVLVGAVAVVLVAEIIVAAYLDDGEGDPGYAVTASFASVEGLSEGSEVRLSGVQVGEVAELSLDANLRPVAVLRIDESVALPRDTSAAVYTDGLLGEKYVSLEPGGAEAMLQPGESITYTQPSVALEDLLELIVARARAQQEKGQDAE